MSSNSLFSQKMISNIKKVHKVFLWVATGIIIASLLLGAVLIFVDTKNDMFGKIQGTLFILALAAFICVNNFIRIEKGNKLVQGFASAGFLANIVWAVVGIMMVWGALSPIDTTTSRVKADNLAVNTYQTYDEYEYNGADDYYDLEDLDDLDYYDDYETGNSYNSYSNPSSYSSVTSTPSLSSAGAFNISIAAKILIVAIGVASIGFWVSNLLVIKDKIKAVKPLKITAIVCQVYGSLFVIIVALAWPINFDQNWVKWAELYGLTISGFFVTALAAWIISRTHKDVDIVTPDEKPERVESVVEVAETEEVVVNGDANNVQNKG